MIYSVATLYNITFLDFVIDWFTRSFLDRLVHTLDTWIGKQGLFPAQNSEMELGLDTNDILDALSVCSLSKVVTPIKIECKRFRCIFFFCCSLLVLFSLCSRTFVFIILNGNQ